jgi:Dyp-type peroxidase family
MSAQSIAKLPPPVAAPPDLPLRQSEEIQGDVLAGFRTDYQTFLFLKFADPGGAREWLRALLPRVSTTREVAAFNDRFRDPTPVRGDSPPGDCDAAWLEVSLTSAGLLALAPHLEEDLEAFPAFLDGAAARATPLGDDGASDPDRWVVGRRGQQVHALVTVGADRAEKLREEVGRNKALLAGYGHEVVFEQEGWVLPGRRRGHEHFGFRDGISQPGVHGYHPTDPLRPDERAGFPGTKMVAAGEFVLGLPGQGGVVRPHPDWMADGSFRVFRRLVQDVPGWWAHMAELKRSLPSDDPLTEEWLAAKVVGRWRNGMPVALAPNPAHCRPDEDTDSNDFDFTDDSEGYKTPHFSHARKMNPRGEPFNDARRRIIRRAIPFGHPFDPAAGPGHGADAERGLLFNAFMASIEDQFEFLQRLWANMDDFPRTNGGADALIGAARPAAPSCLHRQGLPDHQLDFRRFVHTTGAVYAFAPSLSALRRLAAGAL